LLLNILTDAGKEYYLFMGSLLAGVPGFEPGITGSKPDALPLGYTPKDNSLF
jgi:hypothetical protein